MPARRTVRAISSPEGLNSWWTLTCSGQPALGERYEFGFGPEYRWAGEVIRCEENRAIVWRMTDCDADWTGTEVGLECERQGNGVRVEFRHTGWKSPNLHYRISSFCWAEYLRLLQRYVELGEVVAYGQRDSA